MGMKTSADGKLLIPIAAALGLSSVTKVNINTVILLLDYRIPLLLVAYEQII